MLANSDMLTLRLYLLKVKNAITRQLSNISAPDFGDVLNMYSNNN
jgi:hypothetical protein